jgi:hypothetical protein
VTVMVNAHSSLWSVQGQHASVIPAVILIDYLHHIPCGHTLNASTAPLLSLHQCRFGNLPWPTQVMNVDLADPSFQAIETGQPGACFC